MQVRAGYPGFWIEQRGDQREHLGYPGVGVLDAELHDTYPDPLVLSPPAQLRQVCTIGQTLNQRERECRRHPPGQTRGGCRGLAPQLERREPAGGQDEHARGGRGFRESPLFSSSWWNAPAAGAAGLGAERLAGGRSPLIPGSPCPVLARLGSRLLAAATLWAPARCAPCCPRGPGTRSRAGPRAGRWAPAAPRRRRPAPSRRSRRDRRCGRRSSAGLPW